MPFVPAPNIVSVEVRALLDGQRIENRFTIDALTTVTPTIVADIANVVNNWAQSSYFDFLPHNVSLSEVVATDLTTVDGAQYSIAPTGPFVGAIAANALPNEVSLAISLRTGNRGRSARGRSYVLALPTDEVSGNYVAGGFAALLVGSFDTLRTDIATGGWAWSIVSYRTDNAPRVGGPVYYLITSVLVTDLTVDSMRRRKPGVGS
jgi:hypothetical protein